MARTMCRLGIELEPAMMQLLEELEEAFKKTSKVEVIRMGILLLNECWNAKRAEEKLAVVKAGKVLRELIIL